ncbi:MAG: NUDIX hydrolase [Solirubrobacterales bacterium]|nr:NUDIX hydrolase [Solirubrobacterales bacterium]MCB8971891.1 NUDIX hydrolase [Thermoleophilales bacterium]MCO5326304.1 NUDIX hydrolase [Solirubrobacterales bacterium]
MTFRYCPRCATELELRPSTGPDPDRSTCPNCGFVHYENPTPTVQAWIDHDGSYLALRRDEEPLQGEWNMPGGFVEVGERGDEAIIREVREETGLEVEVVELIGIFDSTYGFGEDAKPIFDVAFHCRITGGAGDDLDVSEESSEARWFPLAEFPQPAFAGEQKALARLREMVG